MLGYTYLFVIFLTRICKHKQGGLLELKRLHNASKYIFTIMISNNNISEYHTNSVDFIFIFKMSKPSAADMGAIHKN